MIREIAVRALRTPLEAAGVALDCKGYVSSFADNLLPSVLPDYFKAELEEGRGDEMHGKFRAAHSSSALAVNCFGPFKRHLADLRLPGLTSVSCMVFEKPCPTGLRGTPPHLDVFLEGATVLAIESKCTEHLSSKVARFSSSYATLHSYRLSPWFREMVRLMDTPESYRHLDAAQLIKHAFGLMRNHPESTLLYLYWEPLNAADFELFHIHRNEIDVFSDRVAGDAKVRFQSISYPELWESWDRQTPEWLLNHVRDIRRRYALEVQL